MVAVEILCGEIPSLWFSDQKNLFLDLGLSRRDYFAIILLNFRRNLSFQVFCIRALSNDIKDILRLSLSDLLASWDESVNICLLSTAQSPESDLLKYIPGLQHPLAPIVDGK